MPLDRLADYSGETPPTMPTNRCTAKVDDLSTVKVLRPTLLATTRIDRNARWYA